MSSIVFNLKFFSSYYVTLLILYFALQIDFFNNLIFNISAWFTKIVIFSPFSGMFSGGKSWFIVFFSFTIFILLVQRFLIIPLDLFIHKDKKLPTLMTLIISFVIIGFQIYIMNKVLVFAPMPADFFPKEIINLFDGLESTFNYKQTSSERDLWAWRDILWRLGPVMLLYYVTHIYGRGKAGIDDFNHKD